MSLLPCPVSGCWGLHGAETSYYYDKGRGNLNVGTSSNRGFGSLIVADEERLELGKGADGRLAAWVPPQRRHLEATPSVLSAGVATRSNFLPLPRYRLRL